MACFILCILNKTFFPLILTIKKIMKIPLKVIKKQKPTVLVSLSVVFLESSLANC